ncbi:hypothetical protein BMF94_2549 [Rhodotorula taiwanensis]|uniref:GST N-terminal domain-containing protein n=1 Tax=Rhodotorula taiwanensis TaxID=741276 RepID=A0A2S5BC52_9BASI|nr:hypothetical protein BMF94_2549 [Rhodotorula taiwanensis]
MTVKLYDLVTEKGSGPFFSPFCSPARLALVAKQIEFETVEVEYHDLRFVWTPRLGVEKATAPFVERDDGTFLMDSTKIALWLDEAYPDRPNLFMPEAAVPVDVRSAEYKRAVQSFKDAYVGCRDLLEAIGTLYAPRITKKLDPESSKYWIDKHSYKEGEWEKLTSATEQDDGESTSEIQQHLRRLSETYLSDGRQYIASATKPGYHDFALVGMSRLLRSQSAKLFRETFCSPESGSIAEWTKRMDEEVPTPEVWVRDPKE